jgi:arginine N-succinyltransferase
MLCLVPLYEYTGNAMLVVRPIDFPDLEPLLELARQVGTGMTTFKPDRAMLANRIGLSCASFAGTAAPGDADYVFVLEDTLSHRLAGISAIKAAVGLDEAFYNYRIDTVIHSSRELDLFTRMKTLHLTNDLTGATELCSLYLHPDYRNGANGKLLSKCRFLFLAQFPHLFGERVFAEMRGYQDSEGRSPFYEAVGRHFFKIDFDQADDLTATGRKSFIAELMPRQPLYAAYLTQEARDALGQVHQQTAPARRLLEQEGMHFAGLIDIFDAGPVLETRIDALRAARDSRLETVRAMTAQPPDAEPVLVSNLSQWKFRAIVSHAGSAHAGIGLTPSERRLLDTAERDSVRVCSLAPSRASLPSRTAS